jgi:hypothetical protein
LSLYVYRVRGLAAYHAKVKASAAHRVSAIRRNEFGEASFSFTAPDGHVFNLLEQ